MTTDNRTNEPTTEGRARTIEDIRLIFAMGAADLGAELRLAEVEFNAAMAAHDAEVAAKALEEAADLAEGVKCIVLDPVMEKIGKNVSLSIAVGLRARAAEYRKAVQK